MNVMVMAVYERIREIGTHRGDRHAAAQESWRCS